MRKKTDAGKRRTGSLSLLTIVLLAAALTALCIAADSLEKRYGWKQDYSFNSISTHSVVTKELLEGLEHPVHLYALFRKGDEDAPLLELLDRYAAESALITWEQTDPSLNPALLNRFTTDRETPGENSLIVWCEATGRWRMLGPEDYVSVGMDTETGDYTYTGWTYERSITNAIWYVSRERVPQAVILQGHGELDGETLTHFDSLLTANRYEVAYADLTDPDYTPDPDDLLIFFSPQRDLNAEELEKVTAFAAKGGSFLFTCDYLDPVSRMPGYAALLRTYGFIPQEGIVLADREAAGTYYNNNRMYLIPEVCPTDITIDLISSGADSLLLPGCRSFEEAEETDRNLITATVLRSAEASYRKTLTARSTQMERSEEDPAGPFALALQARRVTTDGYVSRAFILGCSAVMTDSQIYTMTDSQQLTVRVMEFLLDTEASDLHIMAKEALRPALGTGSIRPGAVLLAALPTAVLLAALLILKKRKNR